MVSPVTQIESLYKRLEKAREMVAGGKVHPVLNLENHYAVESSKGDGFYLVNGVCTCPDAQEREDVHHGWCKHKLAVEIFKETPPQESTEEKPKGRGKKAPAPSNGQGEHPSDEELEAMARYYGHHVPGDPPPVQDDRPIEEQIKDLF